MRNNILQRTKPSQTTVNSAPDNLNRRGDAEVLTVGDALFDYCIANDDARGL
jgi:phosphoglycolate phosphatase-like HAD superfamily hydrolase